MTDHPIWTSDTGITDLEADPADLGNPQIPGIRAVWTDQRTRLKGSAQLLDFTERLSREWAIETGAIENLYEIERGVTQTLIEHGFQADLISHGSTNKPRDYVLQLLRDQKDVLDGVFDFVKGDRSLSISYIKELHSALLRSQKTTEGVDALGRHVEIPLIAGDWKKQLNHPVREGITYLYFPPDHVSSEMDRLVEIHTKHVATNVPTDVQAAWLHHRFTQIHPFQDGNGRMARTLASLVLVKDGLFPLVVTQGDKKSYLSALEDADSGNLIPLIEMIARLQTVQFRKASRISEVLLVEEDVQAALDGLRQAASKIAADRLAELHGVFDLAHKIEENIEQRLQKILPDLKISLQQISDSATVCFDRSHAATDYYFRAQIIENARHHIGYCANISEYRSWVALKLQWSRRAQLVFSIHGIGKPFNGSLICAPFLEFKDTDEEEQLRAAMVPLTDDGFVFFHSEDPDRLLQRFQPWRENILKVALKELTQNL